MKCAIISDIHGNLEALQRTLDLLARENIKKYFCAGDIVGYGADPSECINIAQRLDAPTVCGNHDAAVCGRLSLDYFNDAAASAISWTNSNLTIREIDFLKKLEFVHSEKDITLVHGTLPDPGAFNYMIDRGSAERTFKLMKTRVCFVGHSHIPAIFKEKRGKVKLISESAATISGEERLVVNVGSVGQPRDGDWRLSYAVYDAGKGSVEIKRANYDVESAKTKIINSGLPVFLAERLSLGA